jgi:hypothetical protein
MALAPEERPRQDVITRKRVRAGNKEKKRLFIIFPPKEKNEKA